MCSAIECLLLLVLKRDRGYFVLGLGASGVFTRGAQFFVDYQAVVGHGRVTEHVFTGGVRL